MGYDLGETEELFHCQCTQAACCLLCWHVRTYSCAVVGCLSGLTLHHTC